MNTPSPNALKISDISVRQDSEGRYCLNDLHKAAGSKKSPAIKLAKNTTNSRFNY